MLSRKHPDWRTVYTVTGAATLPDGTLVMFESLDGLTYGWAERLSGRWWIGDSAFDHEGLLNNAVLHVVWTPDPRRVTEVEVPE